MSDSRRRTFVCEIECMRYEYETVVNEIVEVQKWLFEAKLETMHLACIKQNYFYFFYFNYYLN